MQVKIESIDRLMSLPTVANIGCVAVLATLCGCGDPNTMVVVSGTVTYQGQPLEKGKIRFVPNDASEKSISGGYIIDGKYRVTAKGGVPVGSHKVVIVAHRPTREYLQRHGPPTSDTYMDSVSKEQYLPAKYNTDTQLQAVIERGSGEVVKDFELTD